MIRFRLMLPRAQTKCVGDGDGAGVAPGPAGQCGDGDVSIRQGGIPLQPRHSFCRRSFTVSGSGCMSARSALRGLWHIAATLGRCEFEHPCLLFWCSSLPGISDGAVNVIWHSNDLKTPGTLPVAIEDAFEDCIGCCRRVHRIPDVTHIEKYLVGKRSHKRCVKVCIPNYGGYECAIGRVGGIEHGLELVH